ncbi:MAG TPA: RbsD/FucU domain-containing protein [Dermatophilaceae bacterium]|nr:RbsD/FucU domain-containing protein [Dermatophilaceae bacterium]
MAARLDTVSLISHEQLKARLPETQLVVRTGESTPYANVILHCGVPF